MSYRHSIVNTFPYSLLILSKLGVYGSGLIVLHPQLSGTA